MNIVTKSEALQQLLNIIARRRFGNVLRQRADERRHLRQRCDVDLQERQQPAAELQRLHRQGQCQRGR